MNWWDTGFIEDLNEELAKLGKNLEQNSMNLVWENLELNRKKHGLRKLGTGQVSSGGKM